MATDDLRKEFANKRNTFDKQLPKECANCTSIIDLQIHHVVPLSFGGSNRISNLVRLCTDCHSKAHGGLSFIEKSADARLSSVSKGGRKSSTILYGYKFDKGTYSIDDHNADVVRFIFRLRYNSELSTSNIAEVLNKMAIPTAGTAKAWTHPVIARMLINPQYYGKCVYKGEDVGDIYPAILDEELTEAKRKFDIKYEGTRVPVRKIT